MNKKYTIQANQLRQGMRFNMFQTECIVIKTEKENSGSTVIRFFLEMDKRNWSSMMVVPSNFEFQAQLR